MDSPRHKLCIETDNVAQFLSQLIQDMFLWLEGLCRDTPVFADDDVMTQRFQAIKDCKDHDVKEKMIQELYHLAIGDLTQEPDMTVLTASLMDSLDKVYCDVYRPTNVGDKLSPLEMAFTDPRPASLTEYQVEKMHRDYSESVRFAAVRAYQTADASSSTSPKHKRLLSQMAGKLEVFLSFPRMGCPNMPIMPILTRQVVRMLLYRLSSLDEAVAEVSFRALPHVYWSSAVLC